MFKDLTSFNIKEEVEAINTNNTWNMPENCYFVACYDPGEREIFFYDFLTDKIIRRNGFPIIGSDFDENYKLRCDKYDENWNQIKRLCSIENDFFTTERSFKYFTRPIPSSILYPEKKGLNNFTSTYPLPLAFNDYNFINLSITIHQDVCDFGENDEDKIIIKQVGFFYVY